MERNKKISWKCRFAERNELCLHEIYVTAPTLGDVMIKLHDYLKPAFIANYLLEVSFYSIYYD